MPLDTYAGLVASVAGWLMRDDLAAAIPDFVALAEADMNNRLRLRAMLTTATIADVGGALPADCLQVKSVGQSGRSDLGFGTPAEAVDYALDWRGGQAERWSVDGNALVVAPAQTAGGTVTVRYYARIPALGANTPTNHVLAASPAIYLYGALKQSAPYLADDTRVAVWDTLYGQACDALQQSDDAAEYPGPLVIRASQW
jgi:hypothetical protein